MARIRTIKPEVWTDEKFVDCSPLARLLFIGLWNFVDDEGRMEYSPRRLHMQVFPGDPPDKVKIEARIRELEERDMIQLYGADGQQFMCVVNFRKHQYIQHPSPSKYPAPPANSVNAHKDTGGLMKIHEPSCLNGMERKGKEETYMSKPEDGFDHALLQLFDYYLKAVNKNPKLYLFSTIRRKKGLARLRYCYQLASEPKLENAVNLFKLAIDRFASSPFHNGKNEHSKKYLDWELLCRSDEKFAYWLDDQNHGVGVSA